MSNSKTADKTKNGISVIGIMLLVLLGLAPFYPEPHIVGKARWVLGGAAGMQPMDWFDLFLHGMPWLMLIGILVIRLKKKYSNTTHTE